ncbi:MAG: multiheme c-type cytochrome, partial [Bacteroidota bacterium]
MMVRPRFVTAVYTLMLVVITAFTLPGERTIFLPGTQPNVVQTFEPHNSGVTQCQSCHQTQGSGRTVTITADWQGSMMAHSARDPVFYAALAVANKYVSGSGEFCIRCHSPSGWLEGRATGGRGDSLRGNDLNGVQCDFCHRMKDPMIPDTTANPPVPGYGNGMFVVQVPRTPKRGPYSDAFAGGHAVQVDSFQRSGHFCGVCHNVSNVLYAANPVTQSPHAYSPIERTYSEWLLSWWGGQGNRGSCQSCHMPPTAGYGATMIMAPLRNDLPEHDLTGGNTFVPDILPDFWATGIDTARLNRGKQRAIETLQSAASLEASAYRRNDTVRAQVRVTNQAGHKLLTGYPEGRRMWLNIVGRNG